MIDRETIQRITEAANIVEVVSEFVTLRRAGVNYKGLCPFHNEKTPSFVVSPAKGFCKCFSCGKGGGPVHFLMELEQMSYPDALKWLARKYHITVEEREQTLEERIKQNKRESLFILNSWAKDYFSNILNNHVEGKTFGLAYFRSRGFRDDIIQKFQLGYSLEEKQHLSKEATQLGYQKELLLETGLSFQTEQQEILDRYRGRAIFPIHSVSGKVVAFGGRILKNNDKIAKYINSPESEIYHKSKELYGIFFAKQAIVKQDCCYLVEGYTDVISMHQNGIENVVASSGTALTTEQINLIHRFTNNITVLYDGDMAGIKASLRGINMLLAEGMNVKVVLLPDGEDPDSFAQKHKSEEFIQYISKNQVDFIHFKTNLLLQEANNDPIQKAHLIADIVSSIAIIPEAITRSVYIKESVGLLNVEESLLVEEVSKLIKKNREARYQSQSTTTQATGVIEEKGVGAPSLKLTKQQEKERLIIQQVVKNGEAVVGQKADESPLTLIEYVDESLRIDELSFSYPLYNKLLEEGLNHLHSPNFNASVFYAQHPEHTLSKVALDLQTEKYVLSNYHKQHTAEDEKEKLAHTIEHLMIDFKLSLITQETKETLKALQKAEQEQDGEESQRLFEKYTELKAIQVQLAQLLGDRVLTK